LEQQKHSQMDRSEIAKRILDGMSDDGQINALLALEALSRVFPRRSLVNLRLVSDGGGKVGGDNQ
jgi:hypothetical protein